MVSSKDGWYPSGTKCSDNNGYCIMGKCLEFASIDKTPKHQLSEKEILDFNSRIQPRHLRSKRELLIEPPIKVGIGEEFVVNEAHDVNDEVDDVSEIAFDQPVDIFAVGFEEIVDLNASNIMSARWKLTNLISI